MKFKNILCYTLDFFILSQAVFAAGRKETDSLSVPIIKTVTPVRAVSWNKDGSTFAYAEEGDIIVRDSSGYRLMQSIQTGSGSIRFLQFTQSTAGKGLNQLVTISDSNVLEFRILPQRDPIHVAKGKENSKLTAFSLSQNGNYIGTGSQDGRIVLYMQNYLTNVLISREIARVDAPIYSLYFSRNDKYLITGDGDNSACIWDLASGHLVNALPYYSGSKLPVLISHNSMNFIIPAGPASVDIYNSEFRKIRTIIADSNIQAVSLTPDEQKIALLTEDNIFYLYDIASGKKTNYIPTYNSEKVTCFDFNSINTKLVVCHQDGSLYVIDLLTETLGHSDPAPTYRPHIVIESDLNQNYYDETAPSNYSEIDLPDWGYSTETAPAQPRQPQSNQAQPTYQTDQYPYQITELQPTQPGQPTSQYDEQNDDSSQSSQKKSAADKKSKKTQKSKKSKATESADESSDEEDQRQIRAFGNEKINRHSIELRANYSYIPSSFPNGFRLTAGYTEKIASTALYAGGLLQFGLSFPQKDFQYSYTHTDGSPMANPKLAYFNISAPIGLRIQSIANTEIFLEFSPGIQFYTLMQSNGAMYRMGKYAAPAFSVSGGGGFRWLFLTVEADYDTIGKFSFKGGIASRIKVGRE